MSKNPFELIQQRRIDSLAVEASEYRHRATGARHFHLESRDTNNVFLVAFPTVPQDSCGVAHILEHTTLCGSRRYPVRDPFFMMIRRSLNTFMNAFTSSDATAYPFASQNRKDFDNLLAVYLDAVFFPRLDELDFSQEGHRLEFEVADDPSTPLTYRGVVYNEMKGAMSSPVARLWQDLYFNLFPTTTYHFNSGGEPSEIPKLSYAQLKAFHASHYHPSQAIFMTYGNFPVEEHQARMEHLALGEFKARPVDLNIPDEQRLSSPIVATSSYPVDSDDIAAKTHIVMAWLGGHNYEIETLLQSHLLSGVLLDTGASPLRKLLETTNLGSAPSELCGLDESPREMVFMCGLEGCEPEAADEFEAAVLRNLREVVERGVDKELVTGVLERLELAQRDIQGGGHPYGLSLLSRMLPAALHGGDAVSFLDIDEVLDQLRRQVEEPDFIPNLVRRWLLDNAHRVRLTMLPDPDQNQREAAFINSILAEQKARLDAQQTKLLIEHARVLKERQRETDDVELLPKVGLEDVPVEIVRPQGEQLDAAPLPITWFSQGTNGVTHQQLIIELPALEDDQLDLLPVYASCLLEVGCGEFDYLLMQVRQASLGSLSVASLVRSKPDDVNNLRGYLVFSGKSLARHQHALADIMQEIVEGARFDEVPRIRELIAQISAAEESEITAHGHALAMTAASSKLGVMGPLLERWNGPGGFVKIKALDRAIGDRRPLEELSSRLGSIHQKIRAMPRSLLLVAEASERGVLVDHINRIWTDAHGVKQAAAGFCSSPTTGRVAEAWTTTTQVNYCAKAYPAVANRDADAPPLAVLGKLLHNGFLHSAIREQGGAYGSGATYDPETGSFKFFSYRDPRLADTLEDFDRAVAWLHEPQEERLLEEAILGVIRGLDQPDTPAGEAIRVHHGNLHGRDKAFLRWFREAVLEVDLSDVRRVAEHYLIPDKAHIAVLTSAAAAEQVRSLGLEVKQLT